MISLHEQFPVNQCRQLRSVDFNLRYLFKNLRRKIFLLFFNLVKMHIIKRQLQVTQQVSERLHLPPNAVIEEDQGSLLLIRHLHRFFNEYMFMTEKHKIRPNKQEKLFLS